MIKNTPVKIVAGFDIGPAYHGEGEFVPVRQVEPIKQTETIVDKLRWQPMVKASSWRTVPLTIKQQLLTLAARDALAVELEALIRGADEDSTLNVAWAETKSGPSPDVVGWGIINVWPTVQGSEGVALFFLHPDYNSKRVHAVITESLLESLSVPGQPGLVDLETVINVSKRDKYVYDQLYLKGFQTVNAILP